VSTYAVHDDTATYWYRIESAAPTAAEVPDAPAAADSHARDALTSLANRPLFEAAAQSALDASGTERACLLLIDLDDFAATTEAHGPEAANAVLVAIAERLRRTVRPQDVVARLGGDQFAVLFEGIGSAVVDQIAKRVMRNVTESVVVGGVHIRVRANLGAAQADAAQDARMLMEQATAALAEAKAAAEEHVAWFGKPAGPGPA
jgi:diguanylate cyclase (GGDEF)-like protein